MQQQHLLQNVVTVVLAVVQLLSSGADGLVKLWNVRSTECLNTFDGHEDKVWALTVGGVQEGLVATGGGDARVQVWEDCTLQDKAEAAEEEEVTLLKQQRLSNALQVPWCTTPLSLHLAPPPPLQHPNTLPSQRPPVPPHAFHTCLMPCKSKSYQRLSLGNIYCEATQTSKRLTNVKITRPVCDFNMWLARHRLPQQHNSHSKILPTHGLNLLEPFPAG